MGDYSPKIPARTVPATPLKPSKVLYNCNIKYQIRSQMKLYAIKLAKSPLQRDVGIYFEITAKPNLGLVDV